MRVDQAMTHVAEIEPMLTDKWRDVGSSNHMCTKALLSHLPSRDITGFVRSVALEPRWKRQRPHGEQPREPPPHFHEDTEAHDASWKKL